MTGKYSAVLFSGGLDSAVLIAQAMAPRLAGEGPAGLRRIVPIYISVGFAWEAEERAMAQRLFGHPRFAGALPPVTLSFDMRDVFPPTHWAVCGEPPASDTPDTDVYIDASFDGGFLPPIDLSEQIGRQFLKALIERRTHLH